MKLCNFGFFMSNFQKERDGANFDDNFDEKKAKADSEKVIKPNQSHEASDEGQK
jgi:hypothetical protein